MNRAQRLRVLMLTHRVPYPPDRGDRIRAYHLLKAMASRFDVTLAAIAHEPVAPQSLTELEGLTSQVLLARARPLLQRTSAARAMLTGKAITPAAMLDRALAKQLVTLHQHCPFDTVLTYCTGMIGYAKALRQTPSCAPFRHVLDLVDVDSQKWSRYAESARGPMKLVYQTEARRLRAVEAGEVVPFNAVTVISDAEADRYLECVTDRHTPVVVSNGVDLERYRPADADDQTDTPDTPDTTGGAAPPVLIFTGVMSYKPNIDAAAWFARKVMPRICAAVPDARLDIVGKAPAPAVVALGELPGVRVVGAVQDTAEYLRRSAVAVAPMRIAPGVQNKVLEAMACGLAVVCSSAAASGIDAQPGRDLIVANDQADTAARCVRLLLNTNERLAVGRAARQRVQQRYQWAVAVQPMIDLLPLASNLIPAQNL